MYAHKRAKKRLMSTIIWSQRGGPNRLETGVPAYHLMKQVFQKKQKTANVSENVVRKFPVSIAQNMYRNMKMLSSFIYVFSIYYCLKVSNMCFLLQWWVFKQYIYTCIFAAKEDQHSPRNDDKKFQRYYIFQNDVFIIK